MSVILTPEVSNRLTREGYYMLKEMNGVIYGLYDFIFTTGLVVNINPVLDIWSDQYEYRYCYPKEKLRECILALHIWDGKDDPTGPWIKQKGPGIDRLNPQFK